jgi:segregation and condensation protein B
MSERRETEAAAGVPTGPGACPGPAPGVPAAVPDGTQQLCADAESSHAAEAGGPDADAPVAGAPPPDPAAVEEALRIAEAVLFAAERPVPPARLQAVLPAGTEAATVLAGLAARYVGRGVELVEVAGGFAFRTAADLAPRLTRVVEAPRRLPRAAMEALAVIAYHQPCTRGEIEEIRGASLAQATLEALLELGLIAPRGRKEAAGRPTLWGTTPRFLEQFGLKSLRDLPRREELVAPAPPSLPLPL